MSCLATYLLNLLDDKVKFKSLQVVRKILCKNTNIVESADVKEDLQSELLMPVKHQKSTR